MGNFATVYHAMVSLPWHSFSENLQSGISSEKLVICEISHFTNFSRILVFSPYIRIGQFCNSLSYHGITTMTQLLRNPAVRAAESGRYSGKLVICEISHFTNFNINLIYFPWIKDLATLQVLIHRMESIWQCFWKKCAIHSLFLKSCIFCKFHILPLFLNNFSIH